VGGSFVGRVAAVLAALAPRQLRQPLAAALRERELAAAGIGNEDVELADQGVELAAPCVPEPPARPVRMREPPPAWPLPS
jgi:hypothetical protein